MPCQCFDDFASRMIRCVLEVGCLVLHTCSVCGFTAPFSSNLLTLFILFAASITMFSQSPLLSFPASSGWVSLRRRAPAVDDLEAEVWSHFWSCAFYCAKCSISPIRSE